MSTVSYPEHQKLEQIQEKSQFIGEFLDWLQSKKGVVLRLPVKVTENETGFAFSKPRTCLMPLRASITDLLAEFFRVDLRGLEREKRQMLKGILRKGGVGHNPPPIGRPRRAISAVRERGRP